jgi:hypothetical protein
MNGRVFDYNVGRFTSVDPVIQFPLNSQSLNPYSYILNNPLSGTDPTGYCAADTGSNIKNCETYTATAYNAAGEVIGTATMTGKAGALERAAAAGVGTLSNMSNGAQVCRGPRGPDPNAYKKPSDIGSKEQNTEDNGNFWKGVGTAFRDGLAPIVHGIFDPDGSMISGDYDRLGPGPGLVEQGGYKFGSALMIAEGARGLGKTGGGVANWGFRKATSGGRIPFGFSNVDDFASFSRDVRSGLNKAGYADAQPLLQGSAVTGRSYSTGQPFDVGRVSDFDIGLASPSMLARAKELGIGLRSSGTRTGPLTARDLQALGLRNMQRQLSTQAGREVNFMIYGSVDDAASRAGPTRLNSRARFDKWIACVGHAALGRGSAG